jgi:hypothetical protein
VKTWAGLLLCLDGLVVHFAPSDLCFKRFFMVSALEFLTTFLQKQKTQDRLITPTTLRFLFVKNPFTTIQSFPSFELALDPLKVQAQVSSTSSIQK